MAVQHAADPIIRAAVPGDLAGLKELFHHLSPEDPRPEPAKAAAIWSTMLDSRLMTVIVAEIGSMLASTCTLVIVPNLTRGARPWAVIENVVTHPEHRGRGLGTAVLAAAQEAAWAAGCYKVMLATGSRRPETLRFYEKAGFERGGKTFFQARRP
jgi:GNAT superfamily N-acetyltransferase